MTDHILCAVDLTHADDARSLIAQAGRLAEFEKARLSVVTVLPDYGSSWVGTFFKEGTLDAATDSAKHALRDTVTAALPDRHDVKCIVAIGNAYQKVLDAAEAREADMIIVGAHKPDLADRMIGPNAARIVRHAQVSVMVIRL